MKTQDVSKPIEAILTATESFWREHCAALIDDSDPDSLPDGMCPKTESPIEKIFLLAWEIMDAERRASERGWGPRPFVSVSDNRDGDTILEKFSNYFNQVDLISPQYQIGRFRVDFLIERMSKSHCPILITSKKIIVECDGHDFHERTKEQAIRDKSRDRELASQGYVVLRFTGSELWNDPMKCVRQVSEMLDSQLDENAKHGWDEYDKKKAGGPC